MPKTRRRLSEEKTDEIWRIMHPAVREVAKSRMESGYYADAVESACKLLNTTVRTIVQSETGEEADGASLMRKAFSLKNPIIRLADTLSKPMHPTTPIPS